jgi:hypothetical protein
VIRLTVIGIPAPQGSKTPWGSEANPRTRPWRATVAATLLARPPGSRSRTHRHALRDKTAALAALDSLTADLDTEREIVAALRVDAERDSAGLDSLYADLQRAQSSARSFRDGEDAAEKENESLKADLANALHELNFPETPKPGDGRAMRGSAVEWKAAAIGWRRRALHAERAERSLTTATEALRKIVGESYNLITQGESPTQRRQPSATRIYDVARAFLASQESAE